MGPRLLLGFVAQLIPGSGCRLFPSCRFRGRRKPSALPRWSPPWVIGVTPSWREWAAVLVGWWPAVCLPSAPRRWRRMGLGQGWAPVVQASRSSWPSAGLARFASAVAPAKLHEPVPYPGLGPHRRFGVRALLRIAARVLTRFFFRRSAWLRDPAAYAVARRAAIISFHVSYATRPLEGPGQRDPFANRGRLVLAETIPPP